MNVNEELNRLRTEEPRQEAKGELILKLQRKQEQTPMKLISKLGIPTALLVTGVFAATLMLPKTALASPETVAKAIRDARTYVINSFSIRGNDRSLKSKTTVQDGKKTRVFFDANGAPVAEGKAPMVEVSGMEGALQELTVKGFKLEGTERGPVRVRVGEPLPGAEKGKDRIEVKAVKGADGTVRERYFVNGKEVSEMPKQVKGMPLEVKGGGISRSISIGDPKGSSTKDAQGFAVLGMPGADGKMSTFASGQTSVDYLLKLLADEDRWTIERGVSVKGQKLDKFMLKGPMSPIELYVDPGTSLPRILRFVGLGDASLSIEDVYEYGVPPVVTKP